LVSNPPSLPPSLTQHTLLTLREEMVEAVQPAIKSLHKRLEEMNIDTEAVSPSLPLSLLPYLPLSRFDPPPSLPPSLPPPLGPDGQSRQSSD